MDLFVFKKADFPGLVMEGRTIVMIGKPGFGYQYSAFVLPFFMVNNTCIMFI